MVEKSAYSNAEISRRAGHHSGWVATLIYAWRGGARRGIEPTLSTLWDLALGLGVTLRELLGDELLSGPSPLPPEITRSP